MNMKITLQQKIIEITKDTPVEKLIPAEEKANVYAIVFNGMLHDVKYCLKEEVDLSFVYADSEIGKQIYERSLSFLFIAAVHRLYPKAHVCIEHALSNGLFCEVEQQGYLTPEDVFQIEQTMKEMTREKMAILRSVVPTKEAVAFFEACGMLHKASLLRNRHSKTSSIYHLEDVNDYFYGIMLPNTSYLTHFALRYYAPGIWLSPQEHFVNQGKMFQVFQEFEAWGKAIGVSHIAQLNQKIMEGKMDELVLMSETMVEKKLEDIAVKMLKEHAGTRFILIAGPSSAGKTTFSKRLSIHLKIHGKEPIAISMDDFYKNREDCPKLPDGSYDFESLEALDLELFNETMLKLLHNLPARMPHFNFKTGKREWRETLCMQQDQLLIIEGIHGLNPTTSAYIPDSAKFRIYINALTHLNLDDHNRIPTSDYRLIRRIARDYQSRGWSAAETIHSWKNVRYGEDRYIYPYQEEADAIFNSSMVYELAVLKPIVLPLLEEVDIKEEAYLEANRLHKLLDYFLTGDSSAIPRSSILAEFIGNSIFDVS